MTKNKILRGLIIAGAFSSVLILSGCQNNKERNTDNQKTEEQSQSQESNKNGEAFSQKRDAPEEMTTVCQGKSEGESCEISRPSRDGSEEENKIAGTCKIRENSETLSCVPNDMPERGAKNNTPPVEE